MKASSDQPRVLLLGESWFSYTIHQKGFDSFTTSSYDIGCAVFIDQLASRGVEVTHVASHVVPTITTSFREYLQNADVVVLSDIGSNTLLLSQTVFMEAKPAENMLEMLSEYVDRGGALAMVGGYLSFSGIEGKANYRNTVLHEVLPVRLSIGDDRVETPSGVIPRVIDTSHPIVRELDDQWPPILGYNRAEPRREARVLVKVADDPLLVVGNYGRGRTAAYLSDLGPHWASAAFLKWDSYSELWYSIIAWLGESRVSTLGRANEKRSGLR